MTRRRNIDLHILLFTAGPDPAASEVFTYLTFPDPSERDLVYLETTVDDRLLEEADELERYRLKFENLRAVALSPDQTRTYLNSRSDSSLPRRFRVHTHHLLEET